MKDCFEQLRAKLPANQNNKSSKWETLARGASRPGEMTNALTVVAAIDYINGLEQQIKTQRLDSDKQRHQIHDLELQMKEMSQQLQRMQHANSYPTPAKSLPQSPLGYGQPYTNGIDKSNDVPRTLPPIMNGAMQGVQYSSDDRR